MDKGLENAVQKIEKDLLLNESCSVSFETESYAAFHFNPDSNLRWAQKKRAFEGALRRLAVLLKNKQEGKKLKNGKEIDARLAGVQYVSMTSWIAKKNPKILEGDEGQGFSRDFGSDVADIQKLISAYEERMARFNFPAREAVAMRMPVGDFITRQLS